MSAMEKGKIMSDKIPDPSQPMDVRPVQNIGNGTYSQATIQIWLLLITTIGTITTAYISSLNSTRISDVHNIVNSQRTEMVNEITGLKETVKNMNQLIVNQKLDPNLKKSQ
jgi:hypothetical protein